MALSLADALTQLDEAGAFVSTLDTAGRKSLLNECLERLVCSGKFLGTEATVAITVDDTGILTLPREFSTIKGATVDDYSESIGSKWFSYLQGSNAYNRTYVSNIRDLGSGFCTISDPTGASKLKIACSGATGTVRVQGTDENDDTIFTSSDGSPGIDLDINSASWSTQEFNSITAIEMPITDAIKTLTAQLVSDSTTSTLGVYQPGETVPDFRRYYVIDADYKADDETTAVVALCQRQFVRLVSDHDLVWPSLLGALKHGCLSIHFENESDLARSGVHFDTAIKLLNNQLRASRASSEIGQIRINVTDGGLGTGLRALL